LENIARIMIAWPAALDGSAEIVPMDEIEKREVVRPVTLRGGDVIKAAEALKIGKTTVYRKLKRWGYSVENRLLTHQVCPKTVGRTVSMVLRRANVLRTGQRPIVGAFQHD
jgi:hypothetical protein